MIHHIKFPKNWIQLDDLHNYLWKRFPMDRFDFIESAGESAPVYAGTSLPPQPVFFAIRGEQPKTAFFDAMSEAIDEFMRLGDCLPESEGLQEGANQGAAQLKIA